MLFRKKGIRDKDSSEFGWGVTGESFKQSGQGKPHLKSTIWSWLEGGSLGRKIPRGSFGEREWGAEKC